MRAGDRVLGIASIGFDTSIEQNFYRSYGACVVLMADIEEPSAVLGFCLSARSELSRYDAFACCLSRGGMSRDCRAHRVILARRDDPIALSPAA